MITIAVDIGGTFTDVVAVQDGTGRYFTAKVPTTPGNLVDAVTAGASAVLTRAAAGPADVTRFIHGTTVGTNAVLERKGAVTAVLATEGFEDALEMGRLRRTSLYDLNMDAETPTFLAPRNLRRGIRQRTGADGSTVVALDEEQARGVIRNLRDEHGVEAFAVCLLFSFRNPECELRLRELVHEIDPTVGVSLSAEVDPMFREYERTVVTAFDAYLRPVIQRYMADLAAELDQIDIHAPLQIMQSRGGITSADFVIRRPVSVLLSGPAAGVIGGRFAAQKSGFTDLVTIDVGGTSADISLIAEGKPLISTEGRIDVFPLRVPMVDVNTIGAGGGSIAWIDRAGGFRVGPESAGSDPGPACYGRGGTQPTVTDASVVLGYLNPANFAGGRVGLDAEAAWTAMKTFGERIGLGATETAAGIHKILNSKMADEIRLVSIRRGFDPRGFALVPLGGGGPVHAGRLAAELGIPTVIVAPVPGVLSALGLLVADVEHHHAETVSLRAASASPEELEATYVRMQALVEAEMIKDRVPPGEAVTRRTADVRYIGQSYTLEVPVANDLEDASFDEAISQFHHTHERIYGHAHPENPVEIVNVRVVQSWALPYRDLVPVERGAGSTGSTTRPAFFDELGGFVDTPVLARHDLPPGWECEGPVIVEQEDTTLVVYPGHTAVVDGTGNILVSVPSTEVRAGAPLHAALVR